MKLLLKLLLVSTLFSSCYSARSLNQTIKKEKQRIASVNITGTYELKDQKEFNLFNLLKSNTSFDYTKSDVVDVVVKITLIDSTSVFVSLIKDGFELESFELKGEMTSFGFLTTRLKKIYPFFPVFSVHWETRTLIGVNNQNQLIISRGHKREGMIIGFAGGSSSNRIHIFNSIE